MTKRLHEPPAGIVDGARTAATSSGVQSERPADEQLAYLAAVVHTSNDAIVSKALDGTVTSWNTSAERMFGYRADEIIGRNIRLLIPAELQADEDEILSRLRAGGYIEHYETVRLTKQGLRLEVSLSIEDTLEGSPQVVVDLTEIAYLDSQGLRLIKQLVAKLSGEGTKLELVAPPDTFARQVIDMAQMSNYVEIHDTLDG